MKYKLGWTMPVYSDDAGNLIKNRKAKKKISLDFFDNAYRTGDAGDAELTYVEVVKEN